MTGADLRGQSKTVQAYKTLYKHSNDPNCLGKCDFIGWETRADHLSEIQNYSCIQFNKTWIFRQNLSPETLLLAASISEKTICRCSGSRPCSASSFSTINTSSGVVLPFSVSRHMLSQRITPTNSATTRCRWSAGRLQTSVQLISYSVGNYM